MKSLFSIFILIMLCPILNAKDLTSRLGVGFINIIPSSVSAFSVKYALSEDYALNGFLGFRAGGDNNTSSFLIGARGFRNAYQEDNANFFIGTGIAISSIQNSSGDSETGFDLLGFLGAEFFFHGLPNIGFNFESGVTLTSRGSGITFETVGGAFLTAGVHYYF